VTSELQTDRYSQMIRRVGAMIGPGGRVVEVLTELFPVIELEDAPPEILALGGWRIAWMSTERPADPVQVSTSQLFNPAGSGTIMAVTQVGLRANTATTLNAEIQDAQIGGTPVRGLFRDGRFGGARETTATVASADGVAVGGGLRWRLDTTEQHVIRDDNGIVVLTPGTGLSINTVSTNVVFTVNYFWRERAAEQSELNF